MATKKQKRAAALAKREKFLASERRLGLAAQRRSHEERAKREKRLDDKAVSNRRNTTRSLALALLAAGISS